MAEPLDAIKAIHNAFRLDMTRIDLAALESARGNKGASSTIERFRFFNEMLAWHAHGEELVIFPAVEVVAPLVAEAYERDHRGLDAAAGVFFRSPSGLLRHGASHLHCGGRRAGA